MNYVWETMGFHAQVGYTENVQHLNFWCEPSGFNEMWGLELPPFNGMLIVDGYQIDSDVTSTELEAVLEYDVTSGERSYEIDSKPCRIWAILTEAQLELKVVLMSGR